MALVYNASHNDPAQPSSPSLSDPDMILPYDPRLRDSGSTQKSGQDIGSLNQQMARSLQAGASPDASRDVASIWPGAAEHFARPSMPGGWQTESDLHAAATSTQESKGQGETQQQHGTRANYQTGTSFLNLDRYSVISTGSGGHMDTGEPEPPLPSNEPQQESEEELNARNDFARAEEILANAKRRLTTMESNLTRARSINVARSPSAASNTPDGNSPSASRFPGRSNGWAVSAAKLRQVNYMPGNLATGHARVFSENSIPKTNLDLVRKVDHEDRIRSSSAMGALRNDDLLNEEHRSPLRGFGRLEPLKEDELLTPSDGSSHRATSRSGLDRLNDLPAKARSNVQLRDLREQMEDLKDKLDVLKRRTREDSLRRSSMQYLKSPSPFTDADAWTKSRTGSQQSGQAANSASSPATSTAPGPVSPVQPAQDSAHEPTQDTEDQRPSPVASPSAMIAGPRGVIEGALSSIDAQLHKTDAPRAASHKPNLSGSMMIPQQPPVLEQSAFDPWSPSSERGEILGGDVTTPASETVPKSTADGAVAFGDALKVTTTSEDHETGDTISDGDDHLKDSSPIEASGSDSTPATELSGDLAAPAEAADEERTAEASAVAELSHEERPDAFDYENFVISSTMGTYSRMGRRSRSTSRSSTSTIGPDAYMDSTASPVQGQGYPYQSLHHARHGSASSTSSIGTFATANSRSASRLQGGSRAALRQAASREALGQLPSLEAGAGSGIYEEESNGSTVSGSDMERTPGGRPMSMSFSRPRPPSTIFHGNSASKAGFRGSYVPAGAGERGAQARSQILSVLMADPQGQDSARATPAMLQRISPADEALLRAVIEGMQRTCSQLALADEHDDPEHANGLRRRLEAARRALEGEGLETLAEDGSGWDSGEEREFMAL